MTDNPKMVRAQKDGKAPLELIPWEAIDEIAWAMFNGAEKYGRYNFFIDPIRAKTYIGAMFRHVKAWATGENADPDSGRHPLAHVGACCLIVMASEQRGTLIDDRLECESKSPDGSRRVENLIAEPELPAEALEFFDNLREFHKLAAAMSRKTIRKEPISASEAARFVHLDELVSSFLMERVS